jgi:hypothetical protein
VTKSKRIVALLSFLVAVLALKLALEAYRWTAYSEERALLLELREEIVDAGAEIIRTSMTADSLRQLVDSDDREIEQERRVVERYSAFAYRGALPNHLYGSYRLDIDSYNRRLATRNRRADEWKEISRRNHAAVEQYNRLADSVRVIAERIGDPYFPVPLPAEAALERGLVPNRAPAAVAGP